MSDIKVSVIVPTYKPQAYLWECLESLCFQTFSKNLFEVIIVLNGCDEPYREQIEDFIKTRTSNVFILLHTLTPGVSNARNIALDVAKGEYICFIDDDDWVSPNYLEELYKHAKPNVIPLCKPLSFIDGTDKYEPYYITKDYFANQNKGKLFFMSAYRLFNGPVYKLIHRDIIENRRFDVRFKNGEDSLFMFLCSDKFKWIECVDETCIYYRRIRPQSASTSKRTRLQKLKNELVLDKERCRIYFNNIGHYNTKFFLRQLMGSVFSVFVDY